MNIKGTLLGAASLWAMMASAGLAQTNPGDATQPAPAPTVSEGASAAAVPQPQSAAVDAVVVTARRLNEARQSIQPSLGATTYTVTNATIQALPGGDNQQLNQVLLQLPGVTQDGFGQFHVRDDHNNLQYRINGVILPEGIAVFGQTLSPRLVERLDLITGALPAQYGLRTAGIVDITTKSGIFDNGGQVSVYGGSHGTYQPSIEYGGHVGATNVFASLDYRRSQLGIESPDGASTPSHDRTDQLVGFLYADRVLSENDRVTFTGGYSNERFQIPNPRGLNASTDGGGFVLNGQTDYPSELLNQTQREVTGFAQASILHDQGPVTLQASLFGRYSTLTFRPDPIGSLLFTGQSPYAAKEDTAFGLQTEGVYRLTPAHTLRGGVILQAERGTNRTVTQVFPVDDAGAQIGDAPITITDHGGKTQKTYSVYLQDEWKPLRQLTINFGGRFDAYDGYRSENQFSPRVNAVYVPWEGTTIHAGYSRFFSPPPFELVGTQTVSLFANSTAAAALTTDTTPYAEKQNYYDVGVQQKVTQVPGLTVGLDGYYRESRYLIDEGQFGAPIVLTPFNYLKGRIRGVEASISYTHGPWSAYANAAYERAQGKRIVSSEFNFDPGDLAYIAGHYIFLDHDQTYTASGGVSYLFQDGVLRGTRVGGDLIYGSGLRTDGDVPNGGVVPDYFQANLALSHKISLPAVGAFQARLDVINVSDETYLIRDGSGVGVGAPQYGPRRGYFVGLTKFF